jgi:hypothetical protein
MYIHKEKVKREKSIALIQFKRTKGKGHLTDGARNDLYPNGKTCG